MSLAILIGSHSLSRPERKQETASGQSSSYGRHVRRVSLLSKLGDVYYDRQRIPVLS
jgi:hypothetical protein